MKGETQKKQHAGRDTQPRIQSASEPWRTALRKKKDDWKKPRGGEKKKKKKK